MPCQSYPIYIVRRVYDAWLTLNHVFEGSFSSFGFVVIRSHEIDSRNAAIPNDALDGVLQAGDAESDESRRNALASFSEAYWPPLYTFVRRRGYSPADAQDIVQAFFVQLLEQNTLSRADRERGRLRTFLLTSLENFLHKQWEQH